jgi:hypothetical protein
MRFQRFNMKESILHFVWQNKLFTAHNLHTIEGETVEVIDVGKHNTDAGPDFFNSKIKIDGIVWVGNIEIHTNSSDWNRHNHQNNKAYNNVILHIVYKFDTKIFRTDGEPIPQLELTFPAHIEENYQQLLNDKKWIPCANKIQSVPSIFIQSWKNALLTERLEQKMDTLEALLSENNQHWEETFYITLARTFGFGTNSQAFESLAKSLPIAILGKHKDDLFQLEALLFGQSGLLESAHKDSYSEKLKKEFEFLQAKYKLKPLNGEQWKLLRLRPDNFPYVRIAQFAALIHVSSKLFSKIIENPDVDYIRQLFDCQPSDYWYSHYLFGTKSLFKIKKLGKQSIDSILINTIVPFLFCYASHKNNDELKDKAMQMLEQIPCEKNAILLNWQSLGVPANSAFDSQALLHLKKQYCLQKDCLRCRIGHKVLTLPTN